MLGLQQGLTTTDKAIQWWVGIGESIQIRHVNLHDALHYDAEVWFYNLSFSMGYRMIEVASPLQNYRWPLFAQLSCIITHWILRIYQTQLFTGTNIDTLLKQASFSLLELLKDRLEIVAFSIS